MNDAMYHFIVGVLDLFLWSGKLVGEENLPKQGPAVFIANHLDATGPIATACSIPLRIHPWVIADMMDVVLAPLWLQADFVERQLHLHPPLSRVISRLICKISVPLFYSLGCIPVYHDDFQRMRETLDRSVALLRDHKFLLVFPEDNRSPKDSLTGMQVFMHSFARLGEGYHAETGQRLAFYPLTVHPSGHLVVGRPVLFDPLNPVAKERRRLKELMERSITTTYLQMEEGHTSSVLTADRK